MSYNVTPLANTTGLETFVALDTVSEGLLSSVLIIVIFAVLWFALRQRGDELQASWGASIATALFTGMMAWMGLANTYQILATIAVALLLTYFHWQRNQP